MAELKTWSYSAATTFEQCPKKYFHLKVVKDVKDEPGEAAEYGSAVHEAAEHYVRDGKPIPEKFAYIRPAVERLAALPGEKHAELKLGVTKASWGYDPCGFFDKEVWWRGIADLMIMEEGEVARVIDYKTGKSQYADTKQLEILALAIFKHFPKIKAIKSGLVFIVHPAFIQAAFTKDKEEELWQYWKAETDRLGLCYKNDVWNPSKNFTCKAWCPVLDRAHNGKNR